MTLTGVTLQLMTLTGMTLAAACSLISLIISAAVLTLGLGVTGRLAVGCQARAQLIALTGVTLAAACSFSSIIFSAAFLALGLGGWHRLPRAARRACSASP